MPKVLLAAEVARYHRDGFHFPVRVLSAAEARSYRDRLEAVRSLYLAVLSLLHRQHLLRYEPTRTNGEYVLQVRLAPQAPPELHAVFEGLTGLFEGKWYGERA